MFLIRPLTGAAFNRAAAVRGSLNFQRRRVFLRAGTLVAVRAGFRAAARPPFAAAFAGGIISPARPSRTDQYSHERPSPVVLWLILPHISVSPCVSAEMVPMPIART